MGSLKSFRFSGILFCLLNISLSVAAQGIYIPFRVGDKFGISDENGQIKLKPQFDNMRLCKMHNYSTGYSNTENGYTSSLVYKDKIVISDQIYFGYYLYNHVVVAVLHTNLKTSSYYTYGNELSHVYNNKGQRILPEDYSYVDVYTDFDAENKSNFALIGVYDLTGLYSLFVFDKKQGKITEQLIDKILVSEIEQSSISWKKEMTIITEPKNGKTKIFAIAFAAEKYTKSESEIELEPQSEDYYGWGNDVPEPNYREEQKPKEIVPDQFINTVEKKHDYKAFNAKDKLKIEPKKVDTEYHRLTKENGKAGISLVKDDKVLLPAAYDEIYTADFAGYHYTGFIMRNDNKFGLKIYPFGKEPITIDPVFDFMPWLERFNYGKEGLHIFALFDEDGVFHHFANQDGKEYFAANK